MNRTNKLIAYITDTLNKDVETVIFRFEPLYSGGPAYIDGFDAPAYVDLATLRIDPAPKALLDHDPNAVVGRLENIVNDGSSIVCDAVIGGNDTAARVVDWARNVAQWAASIGVYRFNDDDVDFIPQGVEFTINNRRERGPAYIVKNGSLAEGSFVAIGGDGEARAFIASFSKDLKTMWKRKYNAACGDEERPDEITGELTETEDFKEDEEKEITAAEGDETGGEELRDIVRDSVAQAVDEAEPDMSNEEKDVIIDEIAEEVADELKDEKLEPVNASVKAYQSARRALQGRKAGNLSGAQEKRRVEALNALARVYGKSGGAVIAQAIAGGWSVDRAVRVLQAHARRANTLGSLARAGIGGANAGGLDLSKVWAAAFAQSLGMSPKRAQAALKVDERTINASQEKPFRGATFKTIVAASLNSYKPGSYDIYTGAASGWQDCRAECYRAKMLGGGAFRATQNFSTISAVDVFQLVLQAWLEPSPETAPRRYTELTRENKVVDFNEVRSFLPTIKGRLNQISETGLIQNVTFEVEEFKRSAEPYAAVFTIPEQVVINDQIDVFAELLRQLETLGDDCIEHDVAETFWRLVDGDIKDASSNSLVSATVGNLITGGTLDEAGLAAAITALNSFSTGNGVPLASDKLLLVTGSKLSPTAYKLAHAGLIDFQTGAAYPNAFNGRFTPIEWAYFDSAHARAKKDDGSTNSNFKADKTWILLREPARRPAVCVNKVLGFESPRVEEFPADPAVWGTTYRDICPYGVSAQYKDAIVATVNS